MMAGIELENYAIGHEMSNQQSEKRSIPDTADLDPLGLGHKQQLDWSSAPIAFRKHSEKTTLRL